MLFSPTLKPARLPVRRKLQWLIAGTVAVSMLLVGALLAGMFARDFSLRAGDATHGLLRDVDKRIHQLQAQLLASAGTLAQREETIATLALLTDYADPDNYQPLIFDGEKQRLARDLQLFAGSQLPTLVAAYDGHARLIALAEGQHGLISQDGQAPLTAITTGQAGQWQLLGTRGFDWQPVTAPPLVPPSADLFGQPRAPLRQLRRVQQTLVVEVIVPVSRLRSGEERIVGWLQLALSFPTSGMEALAEQHGMQLGILFANAFDAANPYGLTPRDLASAPLLATMSARHAPQESPYARNNLFFDATRLALANDETAWLLAVLERDRLDKELGHTQSVTLAVLAGILLIVVPLAGWFGRRWISTPLEQVRAGVHAFAEGRVDTRIAIPPGDEIGDLAEDFNLMAVALRVREIAIKESEERWHAMIEAIDNSNIGLYIIDEERRLRYASRSIQHWFGSMREGQLCHQAIFGNPQPCSFCPMQRVFRDNQTAHFEPPPQQGCHYSITAMPVAGQPHRGSMLALVQDVTERKRSESEIAYRANYDLLTGLPNRTLLTERLNQAIKQARREGGHIGVLFIDLDFFKQVNDTLGHAVGDRLLQAVAERMRDCVRETDTIARQGGDEFVVLLPEVDSSSAAGIVAEKIIARLVAPFQLDPHEVHIGASIGITLFPADGGDVETLFRNADLAMYRAKDAGRNNAQFFEMEMTTAALERRNLEADLRGATARGEFVLEYQPVIELVSNRIVGAEALVRWLHPRRGRIGPDQFIPLAEESGLIREIGLWVFEAACAQLARWHDRVATLNLSINVSGRQLPEFLSVEHMLATLAQHGLSPQQIVLEITEGVLLADAPAIQSWFNAAAAAGLQLAIDDFGTGYSSLAYLKRFPVHHVKIDKAFVHDMATDPADRTLVEAILAMAHSLGLSVVAEGVENGEQAALLQSHHCALAQGYFYSKPVSAAGFEALLARADDTLQSTAATR